MSDSENLVLSLLEDTKAKLEEVEARLTHCAICMEDQAIILEILNQINKKLDMEMAGQKLMHRLFEAGLTSPYIDIEDIPLNSRPNVNRQKP